MDLDGEFVAVSSDFSESGGRRSGDPSSMGTPVSHVVMHPKREVRELRQVSQVVQGYGFLTANIFLGTGQNNTKPKKKIYFQRVSRVEWSDCRNTLKSIFFFFGRCVV